MGVSYSDVVRVVAEEVVKPAQDVSADAFWA